MKTDHPLVSLMLAHPQGPAKLRRVIEPAGTVKRLKAEADAFNRAAAELKPSMDQEAGALASLKAQTAIAALQKRSTAHHEEIARREAALAAMRVDYNALRLAALAVTLGPRPKLAGHERPNPLAVAEKELAAAIGALMALAAEVATASDLPAVQIGAQTLGVIPQFTIDKFLAALAEGAAE